MIKSNGRQLRNAFGVDLEFRNRLKGNECERRKIMSLQVKNLIIGEGIPKICVPVTGVTKEEILAQAQQVFEAGPDLVEWRADFYEDIFETGKPEEVLDDLSAVLGDLPILFTFRSSGEGGNREISAKAYEKLNISVAEQQIASLVDVEVYMNKLDAGSLIDTIHQKHGIVVASNHHFDKTPSKSEMCRILKNMETLGADILKLAVMPETSEDVLNLLQTTVDLSAQTVRPIITMSMGKLGVISRISGAVFGSAVTFATVGQPSAPGQISLDKMRTILQEIN